MNTIKGTGPHNYETGEQKAVSFKIATQDAKNTARHRETLLSGRKHWEEELIL
jgi:hypothetical protein